MTGDELAGLFPNPSDGPGDFGFRQGVVVSYHILQGTNQIDIGGTILTDVPFLSPGGYTILLPGDVVVLIRMKSSWAILGRVTSPVAGATKAVGRYTEISQPLVQTAVTNFAVSTTLTTVITMAVPVPAWAEVATLTTSLMLLAKNTSAVDDHLNGTVDYAGGVSTTSWVSATVSAAKFATLTVVSHAGLSVTPGGSFNIAGRVATTTGAWPAHASNTALLQTTVQWNSNDG